MTSEEIKWQKKQEEKKRNRIIVIMIILLLLFLVVTGRGVMPSFRGLLDRLFFVETPTSSETEKPIPIAIDESTINIPDSSDIEVENSIETVVEEEMSTATSIPKRVAGKLAIRQNLTTINPEVSLLVPIIIPNTPIISLPQPGEDIPDEPEEEVEDPLWPYVTTFAVSGGTPDYDYPYGVTSLIDGSTLVVGALTGNYDAIFGDGELNEVTLKNLTSNGGTEWDIFLNKYNPNGTLAWAKRAGGTGTASPNEIISFTDGSSIITGEFDENLILGKDEANETTLVSSGGSSDMFIAKYNPNGTLAWAKRAGGGDRDYGSGISALSNGDSMVVGYFQTEITLGQGEANETTLLSTTWQDIFVARYNSNGTLAWAQRVGSLDGGSILEYYQYKIVSFGDGSFVINGNFRDTSTLGIGEPNETTLVSAGNTDIVLAKYNSDRTLAWAKNIGASNRDDNAYQMGTYIDGSVVITGQFRGSIVLGIGESNETTLVSAGNTDIVLAKYNANGTLAWAKRAGGTQRDYGLGVQSTSDGGSLATGQFRGSAIFGEGESNETTVTNNQSGGGMFFAKYDGTGNLVWIQSTLPGASIYDWIGDSIVSIDMNDKITIVGTISGTRIFGVGNPGETMLSAYHYYEYDVFISKYNSAGILSDALPTQKPPQSCINPPISNNLILYLDVCGASYSGTGTVWTDLSPSSNDGELIGPFKYSGKYGGSLLTNKDRSIEVPLPNTKNIDTYSYNAWVKTTGQTSNDYGYIVNLGDDLNIFYTDGNELALASPYYNTGFNLEVGKWYNVAVTHTVGEDIKFYVNGELIYTSPDTNSDMFSIDKYQIGGVYDGSYFDGGWNGNISHVSIYDRALTQGELQQFFDVTKSRFGNIGLVP